ncbi:MAG: hypothetical protein QOH86_1764 [Sphingomonadales bacterium]|nr:hypothetical protein [Sphingomonadales bacterium]
MAQDTQTGEPVEPVEPDEEGAGSAAGYTALVHVHGMGSQRRFEETSALIDALDLFSNAGKNDPDPPGKLARIQARSEQSRTDPKATVGYIRSFWTRKEANGWTPYKQVRFYEVYWAPIMAGRQSPWRILWWLFSQVLRPWRTVGTPWRQRQRLRRAALAELFEPGRAPPAGATDGDFATLVKLYDDFESLPAQRLHKSGSFDDFLSFITDQSKDRPDRGKRLCRLARIWARHYRWNEYRAAFVLFTIALALVLLGGGVAGLVLLVLKTIASIHFGSAPLREAAAALKPNWKTAITLGSSLIMLLGFGKFLTDYLGDVEAWSTYRETDEKHERRQKVMDNAIDLFTHVLADPRCSRVIVTSHSLGTAIACDTLLAMARFNRAMNTSDPIAGPIPLHKIEQFVTMGSPIDKIEYFFESYSSSSHRYKRTVEELRGDIGREPFSRNRKPYVHWINFWDEGDVVSGALQSPLNRRRVNHRVDNVHVRHFRFPDPAASHLAYLANRNVVSTLFEIVYRGRNSYRALPSRPGQGPDFDSVRIGPGEPRGPARFFQLVALAWPWLTLAGVLACSLQGRWSPRPFAGSLIALLILIAGFAWGRARGRRNPL